MKSIKKKGEGEKPKKEWHFFKRFFTITGAFVLAFMFYITAYIFDFFANYFWVTLFSLLGLAMNIFIFIKGKKVAVILGFFFLIGSLVFLFLFTTMSFSGEKYTSSVEQQQILTNEEENIGNLFNGFETQNYSAFSRDFEDYLKDNGRFDPVTFMNYYNNLGKIISKNCSKASKENVYGGFQIYCNVESENERTTWNIWFNNQTSISELFIDPVFPNVTIKVNSEEIADLINISSNGQNYKLNPPTGEIFLIFNVNVKNNENESTETHNFKFISGGYSFSLVSKEYTPTDCSLLRNFSLEQGEEKEGCLIFMTYEVYKEGNITAF
jgi:hypothetical protein